MENINCTALVRIKEFPTTGNIYLYYYHLLGELGRDEVDVETAGVSKISNTRSVTAPLNSILVWLSLADGEQLRTTWNLRGYMPPFSLTSSLCFVSSQKSLTKKSTSLIIICMYKYVYLHKEKQLCSY